MPHGNVRIFQLMSEGGPSAIGSWRAGDAHGSSPSEPRRALGSCELSQDRAEPPEKCTSLMHAATPPSQASMHALALATPFGTDLASWSPSRRLPVSPAPGIFAAADRASRNGCLREAYPNPRTRSSDGRAGPFSGRRDLCRDSRSASAPLGGQPRSPSPHARSTVWTTDRPEPPVENIQRPRAAAEQTVRARPAAEARAPSL